MRYRNNYITATSAIQLELCFFYIKNLIKVLTLTLEDTLV